MFKTAALAALVLLDDIKPKAESRAERYITDRVPMLEVVPDDPSDWAPPIPKNPRVAKPRKPRKKHVCAWTNQEVWGACIFVFVVGLFIGWCI